MNTTELIEKYYNGETTVEEERYLAEHLPADHPDGRLIRALHEAGVSERLARELDRVAATTSHRLIRLRSLAAAAAICAMTVTGAIYLSRPAATQPETLSPEQTAEYTDYALSMLASTLARGVDGIDHAAGTAAATSDLAIKKLNEIP